MSTTQLPPVIGPMPDPADEEQWFQYLVGTLQDWKQQPEEELVKRMRANAVLAAQVHNQRAAQRMAAQQQQAVAEGAVDQQTQALNIQQQGEQLAQQIRVAGERLPDMRPEFDSQLRVLASQGLAPEAQQQIIQSMDRISAARQMFVQIEQRIGGALTKAIGAERQPAAPPGLPMAPGMEAVWNLSAGFAKGFGMGGETGFRGRAIQAMADEAKRLESEYFPPEGTPASYEQEVARRYGLQRPGLPQGMTQEAFRALVADVIGKQVEKRVRPAEPEFKAKDFQQEVGNLLGWVVPFGVVSRGTRLALKGAEKLASWAKTALAEFAAPTAVFGLHGYTADLPAEAQLQVDQATGTRRDAVGHAMRFRQMVHEGIMAPLYAMQVGGLGRLLPKSPVWRGLGMGATAPAISEAGEMALGKASELGLAPEALQDIYAAQGYYGAIDRLVSAKTGAERWEAAKEYARMAAPGMVAFGALGAMHKFQQRLGGRDEMLAIQREVAAEIDKKVADETVGAELKAEAMRMAEAIAPTKAEDAPRVAERKAKELGIEQQDVLNRTLAERFPEVEGKTIQEKRDTIEGKINDLEVVPEEARSPENRRELEALEEEWGALTMLQRHAAEGQREHLERAIQMQERAAELRKGDEPVVEAPVEPAKVEAEVLKEDLRQAAEMPKAVEAEVAVRTGQWRVVEADHARDLFTLENESGNKVRIRGATLAERYVAKGLLAGEVPRDPEEATIRAWAAKHGAISVGTAVKFGMSAGRARRVMQRMVQEGTLTPPDKEGNARIPLTAQPPEQPVRAEPDRPVVDRAIEQARPDLSAQPPDVARPTEKGGIDPVVAVAVARAAEKAVYGAVKGVVDWVTNAPKMGRMLTAWKAVNDPMTVKDPAIRPITTMIGEFGGPFTQSLLKMQLARDKDLSQHRRLIAAWHKLVGEDSAKNDHLRTMLESRDTAPKDRTPAETEAWNRATPQDKHMVQRVAAMLKQAGEAGGERTESALRSREVLEFLAQDQSLAQHELGQAKKMLAAWQEKNPIPLTGTKRQVLLKQQKALQDKVKTAERAIERIDRMTTRERARHAKLVASKQKANYLPHISKAEPNGIRVPKRGRYEVLTLDEPQPIIKVQQHMKFRTGELEAAGQRDPDVGRSLYHYLTAQTNLAHEIDWMVKHGEAIFGTKRPLTATERALGARLPTFARLDRMNPTEVTKVHHRGQFYELKTPEGTTYLRRLPEVKQGEKRPFMRRVVLIDTRDRWLPPDKFNAEVATPGNVGKGNKFVHVYSPAEARSKVFVREGGLIDHLTSGGNQKKAERLLAKINEGLRLGRISLGEKEELSMEVMLGIASKQFRKVVNSLLIGGYDLAKGIGQMIGATLTNVGRLGFRHAMLTMGRPIEYHLMMRQAIKQLGIGKKGARRIFDLLTEEPEKVPVGEGGLVRHGGLEAAIRNAGPHVTTRLRAALTHVIGRGGKRRLTHAQDAAVDWATSFLNTSMDMLGQDYAPKYAQKGQKLTPNFWRRLASKVPVIGDGAEFAAFTFSDRYTKAHLYLATHELAQRKGMTRDQARELAEAAVIDAHGISHDLFVSDVQRHWAGAAVTALTRWFWHSAGSTVRKTTGARGKTVPTPESMQTIFDPKLSNRFAANLLRSFKFHYGSFISTAVLMSLAKNLLDKDWSRRAGATASSVPLVGEDLDVWMRQVEAGVSDEGRPLIRGTIGSWRDHLAGTLETMEKIGWIGEVAGNTLADVVRLGGGDFSKWPSEIPLPIIPGSTQAPSVPYIVAGANWLKAWLQGDQATMQRQEDTLNLARLLWPLRMYQRGWNVEPNLEKPGEFLTKNLMTGEVMDSVKDEGWGPVISNLFGPNLTDMAEWVFSRKERALQRQIDIRNRNAGMPLDLAARELATAVRKKAPPQQLATLFADLQKATRDWQIETGHERDPKAALRKRNEVWEKHKGRGTTRMERLVENANTVEAKVATFARWLNWPEDPMPREMAMRILKDKVIGDQDQRKWLDRLSPATQTALSEAWREATARWAAQPR